MKIKKIKAIEILDSRGRPTIKTFVFLDNNVIAASAVPAGASKGLNEALELRDNNQKRYHGLGVLTAIKNVNEIIAPRLINLDLNENSFEKIDKMMIEIDGSENKSRLGANAILSVSQALLKSYALGLGKPLWKIINEIYFPEIKPKFPRIMVNIINGGKHANWNFDIQEFMIVPISILPSHSVRIAAEIFHQLGKNLKNKGLSILVGDEGGYSPNLSSNEEAFEVITKAASDLGYQNNRDFNLAIDSAASEFYEEGSYFLKKEMIKMTGDQLIKYYLNLRKKYKILSFEDPFDQKDWQKFRKFTKVINSIVIGDDLYTTNPKIIEKGIQEEMTNGLLVKPNQIGTIWETIQAIKLAQGNNWKIVISHRSGDTDDVFISDLAFACAADFLKTGSTCRGERVTKYNRLIEIENQLS
ncbi:MAG: phosphopyruvate hydratase [Patescibacteria group bacterium]|nr:phosphopyruvate hydratase [Patescibacteria group bacterium]